MVETTRHGDAFNYYLSLIGPKRSYTEVALKFKVSRTSVAKWAKAFSWVERVALRDIEINKQTENATSETIVNTKADYRAMIKERLEEDTALDGYVVALIGKAKELIESGEMKVETVRELVELMKVHQGSTAKKIDLMRAGLLMMGEADSKVDHGIKIEFPGIDFDSLPE